MTGNDITVFIDTNCLLHYPPLADFTWMNIPESTNVKIVMCMQVIHELDDKKNDTALSERASKAIKDIEHYHNLENPIRPNLILNIFNEEILKSDFIDKLSPDSKDDRIVYLIKKYQTIYPSETVHILTEDLGMKIRCKGYSIPVIVPDKTKRLPNPLSDLEKKLKQKTDELIRLQNRLPEVKVILSETRKGPAVLELPVYHLVKPVGIDLERAVTTERLIFLPVNDEIIEIATGKKVYGWSKRFLDKLTPAVRDLFIHEVEEYLTKYRQWIIAEHEFKQENPARIIQFYINVQNTGNSPAEDIDINLLFPPIFNYFKHDYEISGILPQPPEKPRKPRMPFQDSSCENDYVRPINMPGLSYNTRIPGEPWLKVYSEPNGGYKLNLCIKKLNQYKHYCFGPIEIMFSSWDVLKPFQIEGNLTSSSLPDKMELKIPVRVEVEGKASDK